MNVLITGGCGFIGKNIGYELHGDHAVTSVDDLRRGTDDVPWHNICVDITTKDSKDVVQSIDPDVVIHAAAQTNVRTSTENPLFDAEENIIGTLNVLEASEETGVDQFIYLSTGGARYGDPDSLPVKETDRPLPKAPYGVSKHAAEHYVRYYAKTNDWKHTTLCFGNVYGEYDDPDSGRLIPLFTQFYLDGDQPVIYGDGEQTRDFIYAGDIAGLIHDDILGEPTHHDIYNVASGEQTSVNQVVSHLEDNLEPSVEARHGDARDGEVRRIELDISRAQDEFGFTPTRIEDGLQKTVAWFQNHG